LKNQIFKGQEKRVSVVHDGGVSHVDDFMWPQILCGLHIQYVTSATQMLFVSLFGYNISAKKTDIKVKIYLKSLKW